MKSFVIAILLFTAAVAGTEDSLALKSKAAVSSCDSSQLILVRSTFWGTLEQNGERLRLRDLPALYVSDGHHDLARKHRTLNVLKWGGYWGCLTAMTVLIFTTDHHAAIDLGVGLSAMIPFTIGLAGQKKLRLEFNRRVCEEYRTAQ